MPLHKQFGWGTISTIVVMVGLLASLSFGGDKYAHVDFYDYYYAAELIRLGENPYDGEKADRLAKRDGVFAIPDSHYIYPVPLALALVPLSYLQPRVAAALVSVLSAFLIFLALLRLSRYAQSERSQLLMFLGMLFMPTLYTLYVGQVNGILLALVVFALDSSLKEKYLQAGVLVGLAAIIKVSPAAVLLIFLFRQKWMAVIGALAVCLVAFALSELVVRGSTMQYFTGVMPSLWEAKPHHATPINQSFRGWLLRLLSSTKWSHPVRDYAADVRGISILFAVFLSTLTAVTLWLARAKELTRRQIYLEAGMVLSCITLISPLGWDHSFILLLPAMAAMMRIGMRVHVTIVYALMLVQWIIMIPGGFIDHPERFSFLVNAPWLTGCGLLGGFICYFACAGRLLRESKKT